MVALKEMIQESRTPFNIREFLRSLIILGIMFFAYVLMLAAIDNTIKHKMLKPAGLWGNPQENAKAMPVKVSADSSGGVPYGPDRAFDGIASSFWETSGPFPHWLRADLGSDSRAIQIYSLQTGSHMPEAAKRMPKAWQFQGSKDGSEWIMLDRRKNQARWKINEKRTYKLRNDTAYRYYRLYITEGNHRDILRLYLMEMDET